MPDIYDAEREFLASDTTFAEADWPVTARWEAIMRDWEPARGAHLWSNLDDALHHTYRHGTGLQVTAALDFILLRYRFIEALYEAGIGRRHINIWWMEATACWRSRLIARANQLDPVGRYEDDDGEVTISMPVIQNVTVPGWLN